MKNGPHLLISHASAAIALCMVGACASVPLNAPEAVEVDAGALSPEYSSFNATVLGDSGALTHRFATSLDPQREPLTRLESGYTYARDGDARVRVGDSVSAALAWGTAVRFAGMQLGTRTSAPEDVVVDGELAAQGLAALPRVADALLASVGGQGVLSRQNVSASSSPNTGWSLTAQDALGRSISIDAPLIPAARLAQPGCADFSFGAGKVRQDYAIESNQYGPAYAGATVACGAPLGFTFEGHGEYLADEVTAVGVGLARRVGPLGTASAALASSRAENGAGWLARIGFEHRNELFTFAYQSRMQSPQFREIATLGLEDPVIERDLASIGVNISDEASLSLAYAKQTTLARERTDILALQQNMNVGRGSLSMSAGHSLEDNFGSSVFISYKRPLGSRRRERPQEPEVREFEPIVFDGAQPAPQ